MAASFPISVFSLYALPAHKCSVLQCHRSSATQALCQAEYDAGGGSGVSSCSLYGAIVMNFLLQCATSLFYHWKCEISYTWISYTLDISFLFSLLTLKPVHPVLRIAFLQLTTDDLFTAGYSMPVILGSLSLLAKASTTVPFLYTTSFCYGEKYFVLHKRTAC